MEGTATGTLPTRLFIFSGGGTHLAFKHGRAACALRFHHRGLMITGGLPRYWTQQEQEEPNRVAKGRRVVANQSSQQ